MGGQKVSNTERMDKGRLYRESRAYPPDGFERGRTYPYPTGNAPQGANCLSECGAENSLQNKKRDFSPVLYRGAGHAPIGITRPGVNGLFDMGANVWEWARISDTKISKLESPILAARRQRWEALGGMANAGCRQITEQQSLLSMAAVYIGFRCISDAAG